ncbi:MAG: hypothetical protein ABIG28_02910 [archaeon]
MKEKTMPLRQVERTERWTLCGMDHREERARLERLREKIPDLAEHDIIIATDIDNPRTKERHGKLHSVIQEMCAQLGHKAMIPYQVVGFPGENDLECTDLYVIVNDIMVPQAKLFLGHLAEGSMSLGMMMGQAMEDGKDTAYFFKKGTQIETVDFIRNQMVGTCLDAITDQRVLRSPFHHYYPIDLAGFLRPYDRFRGDLTYTSEADCLHQIRNKVLEVFTEGN